MDFQPKAPAKSHIRKGTVVSSRARGSYDFDTRTDEQNIGSERTRRWTMKGEKSENRSGNRGMAGVELMPKPSKEAADPLNWPRTRREFAFISVLLTLASLAPLKMMLVTVASVVATQLGVSYAATTLLTGVPLIIGALAGLGVRIASQTTGKRGWLLGGTVLALVGALWNMHVYGSYAQFMVSRIFQGIGWGVFEALAGLVIEDLFFVHERHTRSIIYNITSITFTWGSPILAGFLSQSFEGYANQIMAINIMQAISILLLALCLPETSFDRSYTKEILPFGITTTASVAEPQKTGFKAYLTTLKLSNKYSKREFSIIRALRPLKALATPSTILTTFLTAPFLAVAFGSAHIISQLFAAMPTFLFPARIGYIFILPLAFSLVFYGLSTTISYFRRKPPRHLNTSIQGTQLALSGVAMLLAIVGFLAWGLYTVSELDASGYTDNGVVFSLSVIGLNLSLRIVSLLLGMLVGGATALSYSGNAYLSAAGENGPEMAGAHKLLEELMAGIFVCGMSGWIASDMTGMIGGLRSTVVALAVLGSVLGTSVGAVMWVRGRELGNMDERVLGRAEVDGGFGLGKGRKRWGTGDSFMT